MAALAVNGAALAPPLLPTLFPPGTQAAAPRADGLRSRARTPPPRFPCLLIRGTSSFSRCLQVHGRPRARLPGHSLLFVSSLRCLVVSSLTRHHILICLHCARREAVRRRAPPVALRRPRVPGARGLRATRRLRHVSPRVTQPPIDAARCSSPVAHETPSRWLGARDPNLLCEGGGGGAAHCRAQVAVRLPHRRHSRGTLPPPPPRPAAPTSPHRHPAPLRIRAKLCLQLLSGWTRQGTRRAAFSRGRFPAAARPQHSNVTPALPGRRRRCSTSARRSRSRRTRS